MASALGIAGVAQLSRRGLFSSCAGPVACSGCDVQRRKSDAELGLNPQQAAGRRLYDQYCDRCHEPYSSRDKKGRSLQGVFKKQFLSESGMPANDERVGEIIVTGRNMMPAFGQACRNRRYRIAGLPAHAVNHSQSRVGRESRPVTGRA